MDNWEHLDNVQLASKLEDITRANELIAKENGILLSYLHRHVTPEEAEDWLDDDRSSAAGRRKKAKGASRFPNLKSATLTVDQKLDIAASEADASKKDASTVETSGEKLIDTLKAVIAQTDLRIAALKREAYEFKRDVVIGGEIPRTGRISADRVLKYFEDQLRHKDTVIDKYRLKNASARTQLLKAESNMKSQADSGDALHYIDFHQLQIENKQYLTKIEEKNAALIKLKVTTGATVAQLNSLKTRLATLLGDSIRMRNDIKEKAYLLAKLRAENGKLSAEVAEAMATNARLHRAALESADLPTTLDYMRMAALEKDLRDALDHWGRKLEILSMGVQQASSRLIRTESQMSGSVWSDTRAGSSGWGEAPPAGLGGEGGGARTAQSTREGGGRSSSSRVGGGAGRAAAGGTRGTADGTASASGLRSQAPLPSYAGGSAAGGARTGRSTAAGGGVGGGHRASMDAGAHGAETSTALRSRASSTGVPPKGVGGFGGSVASVRTQTVKPGVLRLGSTVSHTRPPATPGSLPAPGTMGVGGFV